MIEIQLGENTYAYLSTVDHFVSAEDAARKLWDSVLRESRIHGGEIRLETPTDRRDNSWAVYWDQGQWAEAYVVSEGASAPEFAAHAEGSTVVFTGMD